MLNKLGGDVARAERALALFDQYWRDPSKDASIRRQEYRSAKLWYHAQIAQLRDMGYKSKWLLIPLLLKHAGNVAAVSLDLAQIF